MGFAALPSYRPHTEPYAQTFSQISLHYTWRCIMKTLLKVCLLAIVLALGIGEALGQYMWTQDARNPILSGGAAATWNSNLFSPCVLFNTDSSSTRCGSARLSPPILVSVALPPKTASTGVCTQPLSSPLLLAHGTRIGFKCLR